MRVREVCLLSPPTLDNSCLHCVQLFRPFQVFITVIKRVLQSFITGTEKNILTTFFIMTLFPGVALVTGAGSGKLPQQYGFTRRTPLPAQKNICHSCRTELF